MKISTSKKLMILAAGWVLGLGCGSSTSPLMDPITFEGEIAVAGRQIHPLVLTASGTIRIEFTRLEEKPVEGVEPTDTNWVLGVGVGRPIGEECSTRYSIRASVGQLLVVGLDEGEYCLLVFDAGFVPADTVIEYTVMVSPAN